MKGILIIGTFLSTGQGSHSVCKDLSKRLSALGHNIITASSEPGRLARLIDILRTTYSRRSQYSVAQVDVYSGLAFYWAEAACFLLTHLRIPYVLTLRGGNLPTFASKHPRRIKRLLNSAKAVTAPSSYLKEEMEKYRADLLLYPNPIILQRYPFRLRERPAPQIVWLRAFHRIYNPVLAVDVAGKLLRKFPGLHLRMIGPDKADGSLRRAQDRAASLGIERLVSFVGPIEKVDVPAHLNEGDIFINTTNIDNTPVTVIEAMACGLCIVSTNVGGIPYLLTDEVDALLVSPEDPEAMAAAVERLFTEDGLAARLSSNARRKVEAFDWDLLLPKWEGLLLSIAESRETV